METKVLASLPSTLPSQIPTFSEFLAERQDSRRVPSPSKVARTDYSAWLSLYPSPSPPLADVTSKDAFLGQYIHRIYCRECREQERMAANNQPDATVQQLGNVVDPDSPPQYQMDQMSLAAAMGANKEALNRRLQLRRSVNELVDQGIYPSLKTPAAFALEQRHFIRAQTGDRLKLKIQSRPDRDFLVQHHILEDSNVDPSLQSAQRQLKKAKLSDELNEKIANRPGPLELVEQRILEAEDPIKAAIQEGKLEFHKTQEGTEPNAIPKLPYEVESPKSGTSSPEPIDCDNDSNASSTTSTGFNCVPSPPDITPLLKPATTRKVTIGGNTIEIPITTQGLTSTGLTTVTDTTHQFTSPTHILNHQQRPSAFGATRLNRKLSKNSRPKQQSKQRVIKFHEYKGPSVSKSSNSTYSAAGGSFVTTTGPLQKLDSLTPYQVRVQQQQLYLQCQLEVQSKGSIPTVLVPIQAPATPLIKQDMAKNEPSPPKQIDGGRSRPVTPSVRSPPPNRPPATPQPPLHLSRSLSTLEDMKVADLKLELKQRNLPVSGSKPQLIERLRNYQLNTDLSSSVPSVSSYSDISSYGNMPSVQSFSDESFIAPSSVSSSAGRITSPPTSPRDDPIAYPQSVQPSSTDMETDENSQGIKSTEDIVREQAKKIEELQKALIQSQQRLQLVQQPYVVSPPAVPKQIEKKAVGQGQQPTPVDITDKQVYVATPDGKMTAYKVVLHTGNGVMQNVTPRNENRQPSPGTNETVTSKPEVSIPPEVPQVMSSTELQLPAQTSKVTAIEAGSTSEDFDDVLEALISTGEMNPPMIANDKHTSVPAPISHTEPQYTSQPTLDSQVQSFTLDPNPPHDMTNLSELHPPLSPLTGMDWIENESGSQYLSAFDEGTPANIGSSNATFPDNGNLDWLSDMMQLDSESVTVPSNNPPPNCTTPLTINSSSFSASDPVLTQKSHDMLNIFNLEDNEYRSQTETGSGINWDKLMGQTSNHL